MCANVSGVIVKKDVQANTGKEQALFIIISVWASKHGGMNFQGKNIKGEKEYHGKEEVAVNQPVKSGPIQKTLKMMKKGTKRRWQWNP